MKLVSRPAATLDYDKFMPLAELFVDNSPMSHVEVDRESFKGLYQSMVDNQSVWVLDLNNEIVGICGAISFPLYFNPAYTIAQELFWYVHPEHRGSGKLLLNHLEDWSKEEGVNALHMIALEDKNAGIMEKVYKKAGYEPVERTFRKEF